MRKRIKDNISAYMFLSPGIAILLFVFAYQVFRLFVFSLVEWQGYIYTSEFNRFSYFTKLFSTGIVLEPLLRSFLIIAVVVPAVIFITIFIAHNIYRRIAGWRFYRWLFFLPAIIPIVVTSIIWTYLLSVFGPINTVLRLIHLDFLVVDWFGNTKTALLTLCGIIVWRELGFSTVIFLADLNNAPPSVYEAAIIDGANEFQLMRYVTMPYLNRIIKLYVVTMMIFVLNNLFSIVLVTTNGGPGWATTVLEYYIFTLTFKAGKAGLGTAVSVLLFIITMILVIIYFRLFRGKKGEGIF
jgi:multiple sugar transport system permease protein